VLCPGSGINLQTDIKLNIQVLLQIQGVAVSMPDEKGAASKPS
jgi:hypothetical protein